MKKSFLFLLPLAGVLALSSTAYAGKQTRSHGSQGSATAASATGTAGTAGTPLRTQTRLRTPPVGTVPAAATSTE